MRGMKRKQVIVGHVVIPSDVNRDDYIKYALRTQKVCVITDNGEFIKDAPVATSFCGINDGWIQALEFPPDSKTLGSQVVCLNMLKHDIPIVIGCLPKLNGYTQLEEEEQFRFTRIHEEIDTDGNSTGGSVIAIEGKGLKGLLNILVNSTDSDGGKLSITANNKGEKGEIRLSTNYFKIYATKQIELVANERITSIVRNLAKQDELMKSEYVLGEGYSFEDEFGNTFESDDTDMRFNGGGNGGLINIADIVSKLNTLENTLNAFFTLFNAHVHTGNLGAPVTPPLTPQTTTFTPTTVQDIEDNKVKH